jgi:hypothetical protein
LCVQSNFIFFFFYLNFYWLLFGSLHSSSSVILSVHFIFIIRLKYLFINVCTLLVIWLVVFHFSQAYNNTDFTFVLNIPTNFIQEPNYWSEDLPSLTSVRQDH